MYKKVFTYKVLRTEHEITIYKGVSIGALIDALSHIPRDVKLFETREAEGDNAEIILVFLEEEEVKV